MNLTKLVKPYRIDKGKSFRLKDINPKDTRGLNIDAKEARASLKKGVERLSKPLGHIALPFDLTVCVGKFV